MCIRDSQHSVNIAGGSDRATFRTSLGYANDSSIIKPVYDGAKKYNFRTNVDYKAVSYTHLSDNASHLCGMGDMKAKAVYALCGNKAGKETTLFLGNGRSEEHTSELQSQR